MQVKYARYKFLIMGISLVGLLGSSCIWAISIGLTKTYDWRGGKGKTRIGFSLHNKSGKPMYLAVKNDSVPPYGAAVQFKVLEGASGRENFYVVKKNAFLDLGMDTSRDTMVTIYACEDPDNCKADKIITYQAIFTPEKTIYVNWDGTKLYEQQGPLNGKTGRTDNGYDLSNNVNNVDIATGKKNYDIRPLSVFKGQYEKLRADNERNNNG